MLPGPSSAAARLRGAGIVETDSVAPMLKKILLLLALVGLVAFAAKKVSSS